MSQEQNTTTIQVKTSEAVIGSLKKRATKTGETLAAALSLALKVGSRMLGSSSKAGRASWAGLSKEERSARARANVNARWAKVKEGTEDGLGVPIRRDAKGRIISGHHRSIILAEIETKP
jgi:hypothetical protein